MNTNAILLEQFLCWICENFINNRLHAVFITTIDNPGWGVTIEMKDPIIKVVTTLADVNRDQNDWYYCVIKGNKFEGDGGNLNLTDILKTFLSIIKTFQTTTFKANENNYDDVLLWLERWFSNQCDGDWEHRFGIKIEVIESAFWNIQINLNDTELQDKIFQEINSKQSENNWLNCYVQNHTFIANCAILNLPEVIHIFCNWTGDISS